MKKVKYQKLDFLSNYGIKLVLNFGVKKMGGDFARAKMAFSSQYCNLFEIWS